jgi:hypothetical protein
MEYLSYKLNKIVHPIILQPISGLRRLFVEVLLHIIRQTHTHTHTHTHTRTNTHKWRHTIKYELLKTPNHSQMYTPRPTKLST